MGVIEFFGAESGFIASTASLASGHVDLVLIPEVFHAMDKPQIKAYLEDSITHIQNLVAQEHPLKPHAIIVVAEGVGAILREKKALDLHPKGRISRGLEDEGYFAELFAQVPKERIKSPRFDDGMKSFVNQPRHYVRAVAANPHDHVYCEQFGASAVDNALAGFTDFVISSWLGSFVMVPLRLVANHQKTLDIHGTFWKLVVNTTGQPRSQAERVPVPSARISGSKAPFGKVRQPRDSTEQSRWGYSRTGCLGQAVKCPLVRLKTVPTAEKSKSCL
jgi:6-phosphofructokinase 1